MAGLGFDIQMLSSEKNLALSTNDVLAVVASQDLPLLGTMYDWGAERQLVAEYKTCFVQLSHCQHYCSGLEQKINTFEAYLYGFSGGMTLGAFGRRLRIDAPVAESMNWEKGQVLVEIDKFSSRSESRDKVIEFESQNLGGCRPALQMERRLYDRAVVYWKDMDGLAFVNQLAKELNKNEGSGTELLLETTSLIRWGGLKTMDWLNSLGYSLEQIRGMVVVDASLLNEIFFKKFMEAREVILQSQNGRS